MKTLITDQLSLPLIASLGFVEAWIGMLVLIWLAGRYIKKHQVTDERTPGQTAQPA